ncbi:MAG TPA: hypothetical protein VK689_07030 [Armatimonadota bacterium]|nr:hypothetical protein [Armatimonadota bacterium]
MSDRSRVLPPPAVPASLRYTRARKVDSGLPHCHSSGRPMVASFEPGEGWRWCHADEVLV